jgi:hypothetical protein
MLVLKTVADQVQWMQCIATESGYNLDYMGYWNEKPQPTTDYAVQLRQAMDAAGFSHTQVIAMDGGWDETLYQDAVANSTFAAAFDGVVSNITHPVRFSPTLMPVDSVSV